MEELANKWIDDYGHAFGTSEILPYDGNNWDADGVHYFTPTATAHPITQNVDLLAGQGAAEVSGPGTNLIVSGGYNLGRVTSHGDGNIFVFGDEWITYDALWTGAAHEDLDIVQFLSNLFIWLSPANECKIPSVVIE